MKISAKNINVTEKQFQFHLIKYAKSWDGEYIFGMSRVRLMVSVELSPRVCKFLNGDKTWKCLREDHRGALRNALWGDLNIKNIWNWSFRD